MKIDLTTAPQSAERGWIVGGGDLAGQFYDRGLLDELIIQVAPVTLGRGMPLFPREVASPPLRLVSATTYGGILVELRYEVPRESQREGGKKREVRGPLRTPGRRLESFAKQLGVGVIPGSGVPISSSTTSRTWIEPSRSTGTY